jgi:hypothetical protein
VRTTPAALKRRFDSEQPLRIAIEVGNPLALGESSKPAVSSVYGQRVGINPCRDS